MKHILLYYTMSLFIFSRGVAAADSLAPAMFTNCPQVKNLKSPPNGAGVYFSRDCSVAYVMPPKLGRIAIAQPTLTSNVRVCGAVANVFTTIDAQSRKVNHFIKEIEASEEQIIFEDLNDPWITVGPSKEPPTNINPQLDKLEALREKATESVLKILKFNETLATYEGPKVRLTVIADHEALRQEYQALNPKIIMRPMPLAKSVLTFVGKIQQNVGHAPAALYMDLSGVKIPTSYFTGLEPKDGDQAQTQEELVTLFSSSVAGQLVLSLIGACPFYDVQTGTFPERIETKKMTSYLAPSVDYVYNVEVNRSYEASYNLSELLKRIQKQSTRGGFFTTRTLHSLVIENSSSGWFKFKSLSEDPRQEWDVQLAQTLKAGLIARVLARLGAKPVGESEVPGIIAPGKNGASTTSDSLKKCPHIYCQAGAYIIEGLNAVFGGSDAVSEFIASNNQWEAETVQESKMVPQLGQTSFAEE